MQKAVRMVDKQHSPSTCRCRNVLECLTLPGERKSEAPFGEYPGTYGPKRMNPVLGNKGRYT